MKLRKILNATLLAGAILLLVGAIVFLIAFGTTGFDLNAFSYVNVEEKKYTETGTVTDLSITADAANVYFYAAKSGQPLTVEYMRRKSREGDLINDVKLTESEGKLTVVETENSEGRLLFLDVTAPHVEVYLPTDRTYNIEVNAEIGNVRIVGTFNAKTVILNTKNGIVYTEKSTLSCDALVLNAINGSVNFGEAAADEVTATAYNGSISVNGNVTAKTFSATTKNGQIYYRSSTINATEVYLEATRGNVKVKLRGSKSDYLTSSMVQNGRSNVDNTASGAKKLTIKVENGNVHVDFEGE